jgi:hypothetical protein
MAVKTRAARSPGTKNGAPADPLQAAAVQAGEAVASTVAAAAQAGQAAAGDAQQRAGVLAAQATVFIQQAASVLEREVAAGIGAARTLEQRYVDVDEIRARAPDEVMQRLRRDAHDVIDIVMDLVAVGVRSVEGLAGRAVKIVQAGGTATGAAVAPRPEMPTLTPDAAVHPGGTATVEMALENASDDACEVGGFQASDLIAASGARIAAMHVSFAPAPLSIAPNGKARLTVTVHVPDSMRPGTYSGLMMAQQMDQVRALIAVTVAEGVPPAAP